MFQSHRGPVMALGPQQRDHLTERPHATAISATAHETLRHEHPEEVVVWPSLDHEPRQRFFTVDCNVFIPRTGSNEVAPTRHESILQSKQVCACRDDYDAVIIPNSTGNEARSEEQTSELSHI